MSKLICEDCGETFEKSANNKTCPVCLEKIMNKMKIENKGLLK